VTFEAVPREVLVAMAAVSTLYALIVAARRAFKRIERRLTFDAARRGEKEARALLESYGYDVVGAQVATSYVIEVDRQPVTVSVAADYVVRRGGRLFVAEVKTGEQAPKIETRATRRQLLEYHVAFDAAGVLLVDMEARTIREVVFPLPVKQTAFPFGWACLIAAAVVGVVVVLR
jgi:hypothetical protein